MLLKVPVPLTSYPFSLCTGRLDAANFIIIPAPQHGFRPFTHKKCQERV